MSHELFNSVPREEGLDRGSIGEGSTQGEVVAHSDLHDVGFAHLVEFHPVRQPASGPAVGPQSRKPIPLIGRDVGIS